MCQAKMYILYILIALQEEATQLTLPFNAVNRSSIEKFHLYDFHNLYISCSKLREF